LFDAARIIPVAPSSGNSDAVGLVEVPWNDGTVRGTVVAQQDDGAVGGTADS